MATLIDLSKTIQYNKQDPWFMRVKIKHQDHKAGGKQVRFFLGLPKKLFPTGWIGWANDTIKLGVHSVTHIDAPWHYHPTVNGEPAKTIDEVPLDWCYGDGLMIDMTHKEEFDPITVSDLEQALAKSDSKISAGNIILIRTGSDKYMGTKDFPHRGTGMSAEATEWLIDQGVKVMGIDAWGWDVPLRHQISEAKKSGNKELFWEAHLVGRRKEYCHIEQLTNLGALPAHGFKVCVFPLKIKGASAAPARVVAILD